MGVQLENREKYLLYCALCFICVFILMQFIVFPLIEKKDRLNRSLQVKTKILEDIYLLKSEYQEINQNDKTLKSGFAKREKGFTLFSFIDKIAGEVGIKDHISYMKPSTKQQKNSNLKISLIEMKIKALTLQQLTSYLYRIETSDNKVYITKMSILKTSKPEGFINAILQVETIEV